MLVSGQTIVPNSNFIPQHHSDDPGKTPHESVQSEPPNASSGVLLQRARRMLVSKEEKLRIIQDTPPDGIPQLPVNTFWTLDVQGANSLTADKMAKLTARQIFAIPAWTLQHLSPKQVASISLESWRALPKNIIKNIICPKNVIRAEYLMEMSEDQISGIPEELFQYFTAEQIRELSPKVFAKLSSNRLNQLNANAIQAITRDQLSEIPRKTWYDLKENFCLSLTNAQIPWLDDKISEIAPSIFHNLGISRILSALNNTQIQWLTTNQLKAVSPLAFLQLTYILIQQRRSLFDFVECLHFVQLRCLTPAQVAIFNQPNGENIIVAFDLGLQYFVRPRDQIQRLTQTDLQRIPPTALRLMDGNFLNKLTPQQIAWFTPQQRAAYTMAQIQAANAQTQQPDTLWQSALRNLLRADQLVETGPAFPTNLNPGKIATLEDWQLKALTLNQIRDQNWKFFIHLAIQSRFAMLTLEQRQAINPEIYSKLQIRELLGMLYPPLIERQQNAALYQQHYQQFIQIIRDLTEEQVAAIPISVYRGLDDNFLCYLSPERLSKVPVEVFRYVGEEFVRNLTWEHIKNLSFAQVYNIRPEIFFRNLSPAVLPGVLAEVFRYAGEEFVNHLTPQQASSLTAKQVCQIKPEIFALIPEEILSHLSLEVCENLPPEHFKMLKKRNVHFLRAFSPEQISKLPANLFSDILIELAVVENLDPQIFTRVRADQLNSWAEEPLRTVRIGGRQMIRHSMWDLTREQIHNIPRNVIEALTSKMLKTLQMTQVRLFTISQLNAISKRTFRELLEIDSSIIEYFVSRNIITQEQVDIWKQIPLSDFPISHTTSSEEPPHKQFRATEHRVVVLIDSETKTSAADRAMSQQAMENYLDKLRPAGDFVPDVYKIIYKANGDWKWNKYDPITKNWLPQENALQGNIRKANLIGHGKNNEIEGINSNELADGIRRLFGHVDQVDQINLNACGIDELFGMNLYRALSKEEARLGAISSSKQTRFLEITGTKYPVYFTGATGEGSSTQEVIIAGQRVYEIKDGELQHGVPNGRWKVRSDGSNGLHVGTYSTRGDGRIIHPAPEHAGPFGDAEQLQEFYQVKRKWEGLNEKIHALTEHVVENIPPTFYKNKKDLLVSIPHLKETKGKFSVLIVDTKTGTTLHRDISKELAAPVLSELEKLNSCLSFIKPHIEKTPEGHLSFKNGIELGIEKSSLLGMNLFFLVQALKSLNEKGASPTQQFIMYYYLSGAVTATVGDVVQTGQWISTRMAPGGVIERSLGRLGRFFGGANILFSVGSTLYDLNQAITAKDEATRAGAGIRFSFATMALGIGMAGGPFAEFATPLAIGGSGIATFAEHIIQEQEEAHRLLDELIKIEDAYEGGGFTKDAITGTLKPKPGVVITEIDFQSGKVTYGSPWMRKNVPLSETILPVESASPQDSNAYFEIRQALGKPSEEAFDTSASEMTLPFKGKDYLDYFWELVGINWSPRELNVWQKLVNFGVAHDYHHVTSPGGLRRVAVKANPVKIRLDEKLPMTLHFDPRADKKEVSYEIEGNGGFVLLKGWHPGVSACLKDGINGPTSFLFEMSGAIFLGEEDISMQNEILAIKDQEGQAIQINISGLRPDSKITVTGREAIWNVDTAKSQIRTLHLRGNESLEEFSRRAKMQLDHLNNQGKTADEVLVYLSDPLPTPARSVEEIMEVPTLRIREDVQEMLNECFPNPYGNVQIISDVIARNNRISRNMDRIYSAPEKAAAEKNAYQNALKKIDQDTTTTIYDSKSGKMIGFDTDAVKLTKGAKLVKLTEKQAFFFHAGTKTLWELDRSTNTQKAKYEFNFATVESSVEHFLREEDWGQFNLVIRHRSGREIDFLLILKENTIWVAEISGLDSDELEVIKNLYKEISLGVQPPNSTNKLFEILGLLPVGTLPQKNLKVGRMAGWLKLNALNKEAIYVNTSSDSYYSISNDGKKVFAVNFVDPTKKIPINYEVQNDFPTESSLSNGMPTVRQQNVVSTQVSDQGIRYHRAAITA